MGCRSQLAGRAELHVGNFVAEHEGGVCGERVSSKEGHVCIGEEHSVVLCLLEGSQEFGLDLRLCLLEDHLSLDGCHLQVILLLLDHLLEVDALDLEVRVRLDDLLALLGQLLLHSHLLLLRSDEEVHLQLLDLLEVAADAVRNVGLGDPDGEDFNAGRPLREVLVEGLDEFLIELVEDADVDLLKRVFGAELVDFVVQLVSDPELLVVLGVVEHCLIDGLLAQLVDHFYLVEVDQRSVGGAAGDVGDCVGLDADLHLDELLVEGDAEVEARFAELRLQHTQCLVDAHVPFLHLVEAAEHREQVGSYQRYRQTQYAHIQLINPALKKTEHLSYQLFSPTRQAGCSRTSSAIPPAAAAAGR